MNCVELGWTYPGGTCRWAQSKESISYFDIRYEKGFEYIVNFEATNCQYANIYTIAMTYLLNFGCDLARFAERIWLRKKIDSDNVRPWVAGRANAFKLNNPSDLK